MNKIILLLLITLFIACQQENPNEKITQSEPTTESKVEEATPVTISPVKTTEKPIVINTTGLVKASSFTKYSFKIGGVIEDLKVEEGDRVRKGQLLASLRLTEIDAQYEQAILGKAKAQRDKDRVEALYRDSIATLEDFQNVQTQLALSNETVEQVEFNRQYAKIYATADGYITHKLANPGEVIPSGSPVFIANDAAGNLGWILECAVNDLQWTQLNVRDKCEVQLDAYPNQTLQGRIKNKAAQSDPVSGSFRIEIDLSPKGLVMAEGMFGQVEIATKIVNKRIAIPYDALVEANGRKGFVYISQGDTIAKRMPVSISDIETDKVYIREGLSDKQNVILSNSSFLSPDAKIEVITDTRVSTNLQ